MNAFFLPRPGIITAVLDASLVLLDVAFLVVLLVVPLIWLGNPFRCHIGSSTLIISWGPRLLMAMIIPLIARVLIRNRAAAAGLPARGLWKTIFFKRIILALFLTYVFIGLLETTLDLAGFKTDLPPIIFIGKNQAGEAVDENAEDLPDPVLLWKFKPGGLFANRRINRLGFREREVDPEKKPGTIRVICLGDSITAQGRPGYSQYLHERLTNNPPTPQPWEAFNMGVHGYSSMQGLKLFQTRVKLLKPDIVTLWFGWNDHLMCDKTDRDKMAIEEGALTGPIMEALNRKRLYMFMAWALKSAQHPLRKTSKRPFRVPPEEYQSTLEMLVREVRKAGAVPILITAPRRSLTEVLVSKGLINSPEEGHKIHDHYAAMTRDAAREAHAFLLDLAVLFAGKECDPYFAGDGIHFDHYKDEDCLADDPRPQPGLQHVATELDAKIREIVQSQEWRSLHTTQP